MLPAPHQSTMVADMKRATVREELRKNPQLKQEDIEAMREWVESQPHLPPITGSRPPRYTPTWVGFRPK